jgi:hypothetical protein
VVVPWHPPLVRGSTTSGPPRRALRPSPVFEPGGVRPRWVAFAGAGQRARAGLRGGMESTATGTLSASARPVQTSDARGSFTITTVTPD